jgi:hypothetical protein
MIAAVMGWSHPYTLGVLSRWKLAPAYCKAVLCRHRRVDLDGSPAEMVETKGRTWRPSTSRDARQARPRR